MVRFNTTFEENPSRMDVKFREIVQMGGGSYDDTELRERIEELEKKETEWDAKSDFSGSYNDLTNKPTIPAAVTESTVAGWGFTKAPDLTSRVTAVEAELTGVAALAAEIDEVVG